MKQKQGNSAGAACGCNTNSRVASGLMKGKLK